MAADPRGGAPSQPRFTRETGVRSIAGQEQALTAADLLRRVEQQAEELAKAQASIETLTAAVEAERSARGEAEATLAKERAKSRKLATHVRQLSRAQKEAAGATDLDEATARAEALEEQLGQAWGRIEQLRIQLAWATRPLWRRLLRRRPKSH